MHAPSLLAALTFVGIAAAAAIPDGSSTSPSPPLSIIIPPFSAVPFSPSETETQSLPSGSSLVVPGAQLGAGSPAGLPTSLSSTVIIIPPLESATLSHTRPTGVNVSSHAHQGHAIPSAVRPSHNSSATDAHFHSHTVSGAHTPSLVSNLSVPPEPTASTA